MPFHIGTIACGSYTHATLDPPLSHACECPLGLALEKVIGVPEWIWAAGECQLWITPSVCVQEGNTCLHWAANVGCAPIIRSLLEAGADTNAQNNQGDSPLHLAARERRYQCMV